MRACLHLDTWNAVKLLEDAVVHLGWNAYAHITNRDYRLVPHLLQGHSDRSALRRVLAGICQQVDQNLADANRVDFNFKRLARNFKGESRASARRVFIYQLPAEFNQVAAFAMEDKHVCLDKRNVQ